MAYALVKETSFEKTRKNIHRIKKTEREAKIAFSSNNDDLNRKIIEKEMVDVLLINLSGRKDFQKQRDSGFNQVMAKLSKKNNIAIGINLDEIMESSGNRKLKSEIIARVKQNIKLCNKNKLQMQFISQKKENLRNVYDLKSLGLTLGMPTWMTSKLVEIGV